MANLLDDLHTRRGELLDLKYERSRRLLDKKGCYTSDDFKDLDAQIADITEQIELADVKTWLPEAAEARADAVDYNDLKATQEDALQIGLQ